MSSIIEVKIAQLSKITELKRHTLNARIKSYFNKTEIKRSSANQILLSPIQVAKVIEDRVIKNSTGKFVMVGNLKGGVGKTTISYILAESLRLLGFKTCCVDLDIQANLTKLYFEATPETPVFYDIVDEKIKIKDSLVAVTENLSLLPSSLRNSLLQKSLSSQKPKHHVSWLNSLCLNYLRNAFDYVVIDTPPNLNTINSVFSLCMSSIDNILIPVCAESFSSIGVKMFLDDIIEIRQSYHIQEDTKISVIMNRFLQNQKNNLHMLVKMSNEFEGLFSETVIRENAKIKEIINNKADILSSAYNKNNEMTDTIRSLLQEISVLKSLKAE